jgi:hypothetical protein
VDIPTERDPTIAILRCLVPGGMARLVLTTNRVVRARWVVLGGAARREEGNCDRGTMGARLPTERRLSEKGAVKLFALSKPEKVGGKEVNGKRNGGNKM